MTVLTVWHDGDCPLCVQEVAFMRRLDKARAIRFVDARRSHLSSCPANRDELLARFHACEEGRLLSGAAAFAAMWRAVPLLRPVGLVARHGAVLAVLERLYSLFLRVRPSLQRLVRKMGW
ncbi:DUF393 domain-containing protein [Sphingomonas oryzagri]|uniref:DUF393 domain-containing protein n=1 Tax=Sphingomonas oryzagri TaxID=3042314 RepID=A0ABT6N2T5_9SPHN|nr:DUF393 domain-containing protein [Sphingomonas oryzagri]MDH7639388.1 DUF393 domain-containing protein [Sphingomonas oryzagri]